MITYKPLPVLDSKVAPFLKVQCFEKADVLQFKQAYNDWIHSSKHTVVNGLSAFATALTDGVTGAFADFTHAFPKNRTTVFRGEYPYHRDTGARVIESFDELTSNDKLIISLPFAATGDVHIDHDKILERCNELGIPVFVDCAYFGSCKLGIVNVDYECIKFVAFSLSKTFATGKCRIGLCYYRNIPVGPMQLLNEYNYINHVAVNIHMPIIQNFTPDYMYNTYRNKQIQIANLLGITASDTVFLCTSSDMKYVGFTRDWLINRIGIAELLLKETIDVEGIEWHTKP